MFKPCSDSSSLPPSPSSFLFLLLFPPFPLSAFFCSCPFVFFFLSFFFLLSLNYYRFPFLFFLPSVEYSLFIHFTSFTYSQRTRHTSTN